MGRDAWISATPVGEALSPQWHKVCTRIFLKNNTGRMPPGMESGFIALLSTLQINGPKLTLGIPPAAQERTRDWARMHLFATHPEYSGRFRVLLSNMAHGGAYDAACRNAFEKPAAEMEKLVDAYYAAGKFEAVPFSGRALSERDFTVRDASSYDGRIASADMLLTDPAKATEAEAGYKALTGAEAQEGLAFLARQRKDSSASQLFQAAVQAGSKNARAWLATGTNQGAIRAIELNPKWPDPHVRLAELATAPNVKAAELGKAAALDPRDVDLWKAAALAFEQANQYIEAGKAWAGAERAASTEEERERLRQAHLDNERQRADFAAAERKRVADEEARDLERVRKASIAEIRAAEVKANQQLASGGPVPQKPEEWWDGPGGPPQKLHGTLQRVDCLAGGRAKWTIETTAKTNTRLLVRDPAKLVVRGGEPTLGCGVQKRPRPVAIEYNPARDLKLGTVGEVQVVEFQ